MFSVQSVFDTRCRIQQQPGVEIIQSPSPQLPHQEAARFFLGLHHICQLLAAVLDTLVSLKRHYLPVVR